MSIDLPSDPNLYRINVCLFCFDFFLSFLSSAGGERIKYKSVSISQFLVTEDEMRMRREIERAKIDSETLTENIVISSGSVVGVDKRTTPLCHYTYTGIDTHTHTIPVYLFGER